MTSKSISKILTTHYQKFSASLQEPENETSKVLVGVTSFPLLIGIKAVVQSCFSQERPDLLLAKMLKVVWTNIQLTPKKMYDQNFTFRLAKSVGLEALIQEFGQNYLMNKVLTRVLEKNSPKFDQWTPTKKWKVGTIFFNACLATYLYDYHLMKRKENFEIVNDLVTNLFLSTLYQLSNSILPGIVLRTLRSEWLGIE